MAKQSEQSKWQQASAQITNLKWEIESVLSSFTEEEKQLDKYKQLLQTLDLLIDHILHDYKIGQIDLLEKQIVELKRQSSWMSWKILAAAIVGGIATEVAKYLIILLAIIFGGSQQ